ncbi:PREDICTED: conserved oligomeric Golgi complex subunit 1 [Dufourea novaeangliae]|uniref:Conserved oligomeric Golgi complex subunit 1 n=1 Tax=Dufourea novaeangliae TaxID=178035 RepID=A0A154PKL3_DUFNO|nr:PREDICTED: conserved oligomeric Golgi complex subunit 1 [Dufourea novaeangliae]KZC12421.1 Conserved oligomeric Golgi complex subunit 1 [Dufourea novaeangliae]
MTMNYLDLNIDKLFEDFTIKEIEGIQKRIQHESDRKKIELRTLVGERYRDLILAADTIGNMKITSERVISRIVNIEDTFRELQKKYLIGFKIEPIENENDRNVEGIQDSIIIQIKILMDIPQYIWSNIENKNLLFATQLYLVAQHINYSLLFEVGSTDLLNKYPIVSKQWDVINQFKTIITTECNYILQSLDVQPESIANCLAALVLLNRTSFSDLLEMLLSMRNRAIKSIITDENDSSVKNKIKLCIDTLIQTINLIYSCFINTEKKSGGLVLQYIAKIQDQEAYSLFCELDVNQELLKEFLPSVTKHHKLFIQDTPESFLLPDLQKSIKSWLQWVAEFCNHEVTKLLDLIISIKGLYYVREETVSINLPENWNFIWEELHLPRITFWVEFFQPIISQRVKNIISDKWIETVTTLKSDITELLTKISNEKFEYPEHDLRWFVWKDSPSDIPQKLTKNGGLDNKRSLLMKTKGYSPNILTLCDSFDTGLQALLSDLEQYLYETERVMSIKDNLLSTNISLISDTFSDRKEVQEHLQKISSTMIQDIINFVKTMCVNERAEYGQQDINAVVMARFLLALTTLSSNLNKCFTLSKVSGLTITNVKWQSICDKLKEESTFVWSIWASTYKTKINEHRDKYISKEPLDGYRIHVVVSEWEKVTIDEDSGEGKRIKSEILVPYQPSIQLQKFLTAINKDLNKIIPHTVPKKVLHEIIENIAVELLSYYVFISSSVNLSQKQAFQVLFDIRYSTLLMVPRENKNLSDLSTRACDNVLSKIDPFDYDVFNPFIQTNVKKSIQRSLLLLGNLVPHLEQLHSILGARSEYSTTEGVKSDIPSVLALCAGAPWFPPLTVTAPARSLPLVSVTLPEKPQRKKVTGKENTKSDSAGATIKSGAAAFFGAMGSDWFSSS